MKKTVSLLLCLVLLLFVPACVAEEITPETQAMLPALDSVMRVMLEQDCAYAPENNEFFWTVLGYMAVNFGADNPQNEITDNELRVPRLVMQEYASAAFADYHNLPPLPEGEFFIRYDEAWDSYFVMLSDKGDSYTEITSVHTQPNANIDVTLTFSSDDEGICATMQASLLTNSYASAIQNPTFLYSISAASIEPTK